MKTPAPPAPSRVAPVDDERRAFLRNAGKAAVTAPAVALLVSASLKPTQAPAKLYTQDPGPWIP